MDRQRFWKLIEVSRKRGQGDQDAQLETLYEQLLTLSPTDVVSFNNHFSDCATRADRDNNLYAAAAIIDGFRVSDDDFEYFGDWLISQGEKVFENALRDPESLADLVAPGTICAFEEYSSVALRVWEEKKGRPMEEMPVIEGTRQDDSGCAAWKDDEDLKRRFPKLWAKFSDQGNRVPGQL